MHAWWDLVASADDPVVAASVDLLIPDVPATSHLRFWALQASFSDQHSRHGAGHLGLQWIDGYPGSTAVNWGGYRDGGGELEGSPSTLSSARSNPNTRDFEWRPGHVHRLRIARASEGWQGSVVLEGTETTVRTLLCPGDRLTSVVVWSEVFAPCQESHAVRWSNAVVERSSGRLERVGGVRVSYQSVADGGCSNTDQTAESGVLVQRTGSPRLTPGGASLLFD